ncbi:MAG: pilus assembly protein PilM [Deltaproteobacteria bacterium]|nr:pilus assembly protein PilM [Deltaproteobacteria bacterium]
MARYTLGVNWDNQSIHACVVKATMSEFTIEKLLRFQRELDENGQALNHVTDDVKTVLKDLGMTLDTCIVSLPESEVMHRQLMRPFSDRKKIAGTIQAEMETLLPFGESDLEVDFVLAGKNPGELTIVDAVAARSSSVRNLVAGLKNIGLDPVIVDAPSGALVAGAKNVFDLASDSNYIILYMGWHESTFAILHGNHLAHIGALPFGFKRILTDLDSDGDFSNDQPYDKQFHQGIRAGKRLNPLIRELLIALERVGQRQDEYVLIPTGYTQRIEDLAECFEGAGGITVEIPPAREAVSDGSINDILKSFMAVSLALRGVDSSDSINFRQGDLAYTRKLENLKGYARAWAKPLAILIILWIAWLGLDVYFKSQLKDEIVAKIRKEFTAVMPQGTPMVAPVQQMQQHLAALSSKSGIFVETPQDTPLQILHDVSLKFTRDIEITLDIITIDENSITLAGDTQSYDNVERIKGKLGELEYITDVKIVSANVDKQDQRVKFKLICKKGSAG